MRDGIKQATGQSVTGYLVVFMLEALMLGTAAVMLARIDVSKFKTKATEPDYAEKVAIAIDG